MRKNNYLRSDSRLSDDCPKTVGIRSSDSSDTPIEGVRWPSDGAVSDPRRITRVRSPGDGLGASKVDEGQCALTFEIDLPWPPKVLSPNARAHWATIAKAKKAYRTRCASLTRMMGVGHFLTDKNRIAVHLTFFPPDSKRRDWDNMLASIKSGLDGVADGMGIDDFHWHLSFDVDYQDPKPKHEGRVACTIIGN